MTQDSEHVTLREVYGQVEAVRKELLSEIKAVTTHIDAALTKHESEHEAHEARHQREHDKRVSLVLWSVTSLMTGMGVLVAIYVAFTRGG